MENGRAANGEWRAANGKGRATTRHSPVTTHRLLVGSLVEGGAGAGDTGAGRIARWGAESDRGVGKRLYRAPSQRSGAKRFNFGRGIHSGFVSSVVAAGLSSHLPVRCRRPSVVL